VLTTCLFHWGLVAALTSAAAQSACEIALLGEISAAGPAMQWPVAGAWVRLGGRTMTQSSGLAVMAASAITLSAFNPEYTQPAILTAKRPDIDSFVAHR
jgi:hypothetical protein